MKPYIYLLVFIIYLASASADLLYNTTNLTSANNLYDQAYALNDITEGLVGLSLIIIVGMVTFVITTAKSDVLAGLGAGTFISMVVATLILPLGLIPWWLYKDIALACGVSVFLSVMLKRYVSGYG